MTANELQALLVETKFIHNIRISNRRGYLEIYAQLSNGYHPDEVEESIAEILDEHLPLGLPVELNLIDNDDITHQYEVR